MKLHFLLILHFFLLGTNGLTQIQWDLPEPVRYDLEAAFDWVNHQLEDTSLSKAQRVHYQCILSDLYNKQGRYARGTKILLGINNPEELPTTYRIKFYLAKANNIKYKGGVKDAKLYYNRAIDLANQTGERLLALQSIIEKAEFFRKITEFQSGLKEIEKALWLNRSSSSKEKELRAYALNRKAAILNELSRPNNAISISHQSIAISKEVNNPYLIATSQNEIGYAYKHVPNIDSALHYYKLAEALFRKNKMIGDAIHVKFNRLELSFHHDISPNETLAGFQSLEREIKEQQIDYPLQQIILYQAMNAESRGDFKKAWEQRMRYHSAFVEEFDRRKFLELENLRQENENKGILEENQRISKRLASTEKELEEKDERIAIILFGFVTVAAALAIIFRYYITTKSLSKRLKDQNQQKDYLIQEIHHRVKNNLHFVHSLLEMQKNSSDDIAEAVGLDEASLRISSVSLLHEMLYQEEHLDKINIKHYLQDLMQHLRTTFGHSNKEVKCQLYIEELLFSIQNATAVGLLITELFTNSYKHAFADIQNPEFQVHLSKIPARQEVEIIVQDNGLGSEQPQQIDGSKTLGLRLIDIFSRQLKGKYSLSFAKGFTYQLNFKYDEV